MIRQFQQCFNDHPRWWERERPFRGHWLKPSYFLLITGFELMRTPLRLVILCLRMSCWKKGTWQISWFHVRTCIIFCNFWHHFWRYWGTAKTTPHKDSEISITFNYPQPLPLITYYVWDLLHSNNSDALHLHCSFSKEFKALYRYGFSINIKNKNVEKYFHE